MRKNINLAHIKLISLFIAALCKAKTVCFSLLSTVFDSSVKFASCLLRIQRFFAEFDLDRDLVARVIFRLLPVKGPLCRAIDRTNWRFGSTDINIFMLAVVYDGVAYPLLFSMLPKKAPPTRGRGSNLCTISSTPSASSNTAGSPKVPSATVWTSLPSFSPGEGMNTTSRFSTS
ncbi:MAG: hypothetical protein J5741_00400 [Bacteroidales bacterium]|nr:hypothetical protein [Bacteroidales bacterium]